MTGSSSKQYYIRFDILIFDGTQENRNASTFDFPEVLNDRIASDA